jgi:transcriptional regulator with XRE-family HTH domain
MSSATKPEANASLAAPTRLLLTYMEEAAAKLARRREIVGDRIREARERKGWLQKELAGRVHVEPQTVSNWERGVTTPDLDKLAILARELDQEVADFLVEPAVEASREEDWRVLREELAGMGAALARIEELLRLREPPPHAQDGGASI